MRVEGTTTAGKAMMSQASGSMRAGTNVAAAASGTVVGTSKASAKTLTKKKLQEFNDAN